MSTDENMSQGKSRPIAAIFIDYQFEDLEVTFPKIRLEEAGFRVLVFGSHPAGTKYIGKYGYPVRSDFNMDALFVSGSSVSDNGVNSTFEPTSLLHSIQALVLPGGFSPDYMRRDKRMLAAIVFLFNKKIPIGAICHGPWMFCSARGDDGYPIIKGLRCTSFIAIKDDIINAGGKWEDAPVINDQNIISSRTPSDIVPFCHAIIEAANIKKSLPIFTVDSFSKGPFAGNPAAVCLVGGSMAPLLCDDNILQKIAAEMNISETAFVQVGSEILSDTFDSSFPPEFTSETHFKLRWFTPTVEVDLCGHATLATAAVIMEHNASKILTFSTKSGDLIATRNGDFIFLDMPLNKPILLKDASEYASLITAVIGEMNVRACGYSSKTRKLLLELDSSIHSREDLEKITPDFLKMQEIHDGSKVKGVIVTLRGVKNYDFVSRYFAPWNGIMEDPVTGSAHTVLAGWWSDILKKTEMNARQCSGRGGDLKLAIKSSERVSIGGCATIVLRGKIDI